MKPLLIVGIDPGTTVGFAVLDIKGNLLHVYSSKLLNLSKVIERVIAIGKPLIVGCDVAPSPKFVEQFATKTGSKLIVPDQDLTRKEKDELIHQRKTKNMHEKDSLASALYAYKIINPLLDKTDRFLRKLKKQELTNSVKELVVKKNIAIKSAISLLEKPTEESRIIKRVIQKKIFLEEDFLKLYNRWKKTEQDIGLLKTQNKKLKDHLALQEKKTKFLIKKLTRQMMRSKGNQTLILKEKAIKALDKEQQKNKTRIQQLRKEITNVNNLIAKINDNILVKKLDTLSYREFGSKKDKLNIKPGDILLIQDADAYSKKTLDQIKEKINLIIAKKISKKTKEQLPFLVVDAKNLKLIETEYFALVNKKKLQEEKAQHDILQKIIAEHKKERQRISL